MSRARRRSSGLRAQRRRGLGLGANLGARSRPPRRGSGRSKEPADRAREREARDRAGEMRAMSAADVHGRPAHRAVERETDDPADPIRQSPAQTPAQAGRRPSGQEVAMGRDSKGRAARVAAPRRGRRPDGGRGLLAGQHRVRGTWTTAFASLSLTGRRGGAGPHDVHLHIIDFLPAPRAGAGQMARRGRHRRRAGHRHRRANQEGGWRRGGHRHVRGARQPGARRRRETARSSSTTRQPRSGRAPNGASASRTTT